MTRKTAKEPPSPFLEDPRQRVSEEIRRAIESPVENVRAIHLRAAENAAELAASSGIPFKPRAG